MTLRLTVALLSVCAILFAASAGRAAPPTRDEALKYNQALVESLKKLNAAGLAWGQKAHFNDDVTPDAEGLKEAYKNYAKVYGEVESALKVLAIPDAKSARDLQKVNQNYIDYQDGFIKKILKEATDVLTDPKLKDKDKKEKAVGIIQRAEKEEQNLLTEFTKRQEDFAKEFGIELKKQ